MEIFQGIPNLVKIVQKHRPLYTKTQVRFIFSGRHKFAVKAFVCNIQYFYMVGCDM